MVKRFEISLPDELLAELGWPDAEVSDRVQETLVMELLRLGRISEGYAAELLDLDRWTLRDVMASYDIPAIRMTAEEAKQEAAKVIGRD